MRAARGRFAPFARELRRANARLADQHALFAGEVREGGFAALAGGFARGAMNVGGAEGVLGAGVGGLA